jgi:hypothetical protein
MANSPELTKGRHFKLWDYSVSHSNLLIRSPEAPGIADNVDIICAAVDYVAVHTLLGEIEVREAPPEVIQEVEKKMGKPLAKDSRVWVFEGASGQSVVACAQLQIKKHSQSMFWIPYDRIRAPE